MMMESSISILGIYLSNCVGEILVTILAFFVFALCDIYLGFPKNCPGYYILTSQALFLMNDTCFEIRCPSATAC